MPQIVYAIAQGASFLFFGGGITSAIAWAVVATTAVSYYVKSQIPNLNNTSNIGRQYQMSQDPSPLGQVVYGETRVSGPIAFAHKTGTAPDEYHHFVVILACHELAEISDTMWYGDAQINLTSGTPASGRFAGKLWVYKHLGSDTQTVDTALNAVAPSLWTTNHRLRGLAYVYVRLLYDQDTFPRGLENISFLVRGKPVYDDRSASTAYSNNPALILQDYLKDTRYGLQAALPFSINSTALQAAANICDEVIDTNVTVSTTGSYSAISPVITVASLSGIFVGMNVWGTDIPDGAKVESIIPQLDQIVLNALPTSGGTGEALDFGAYEFRYTLNGAFTTDVPPQEVIQHMTQCMAGSLVPVGDAWYIRAGAYETPTITLDEDDLRAGMEIQVCDSQYDTCNRVQGEFASPKDLYVLKPYPTIENSYYLSQDIEIDLPRELSLPWVTSSATAQRLAKIELERARQEIMVQFPAKITALDLIAGDNVMITSAKHGWSSKVFEVVETEGVLGQDRILGQNLTLRETASGVWDWNDGEETVVDLATNTDLPNPFEVAPVSGVTVTSESLFQQGDSAITAQTSAGIATLFQPSSFADVRIGQRVSGPFIPDGTRVIAYDNLLGSGYIYLDQAATSDGGADTYHLLDYPTLNKDGSQATAFTVGWTSPEDRYVLHNGFIEVQWRSADSSAATWVSLPLLYGTATHAVIPEAVSGYSYDVRVRAGNALGVRSDWVEVLDTLYVGDPWAPNIPIDRSITAGDSVTDGIPIKTIFGTQAYACRLRWEPNTDADLDHYEITASLADTYEPDHSSFTQLGDLISVEKEATYFDVYTLSLTGQFRWIRAVDRNGNASGWGTFYDNLNTYLGYPSPTLASTDPNLYASGETVATMDALKARQTPTDDALVPLSGYHAQEDGGGGYFRWDATSSATPDDALVVEPDAVASSSAGLGRYFRIYDGLFINVKWYGAKGDNINDDTAAIQAAIDSAVAGTTGASRTGLKVYFPHGAYKVTSTITISNPNVVLEGESGTSGGYGETVGHGSRIVGSSSDLGDDDIIYVTGSYCEFRHLSFATSGGTPDTQFATRPTGAAINIAGASVFTQILFCTFTNNVTCVHVSDATVLRCLETRFTNFLKYGVRCSTYDDSSATTADRSSGRFLNCRFSQYGSYSYASAGEKGSGIYIQSGGGFSAIGCHFIQGDYGINMDWETSGSSSIHFVICGCTFDEPIAAGGIHIRMDNSVAANCHNLTVTGCTFSCGSGKIAIHIVDGWNGVAIVGNSFNIPGADGIKLEGSINTIAIGSNAFYGAGTGVRASSSSISNGTLVGNVFDPSLAIPFVDSITSSNFVVVGNLNINETKKITAPSTPATGVTKTNVAHKHVDVYVTGGTVTAVSINTNALPIVPNPIHLAPGDDLVLTYTGTLVWEWWTR